MQDFVTSARLAFSLSPTAQQLALEVQNTPKSSLDGPTGCRPVSGSSPLINSGPFAEACAGALAASALAMLSEAQSATAACLKDLKLNLNAVLRAETTRARRAGHVGGRAQLYARMPGKGSKPSSGHSDSPAAALAMAIDAPSATTAYLSDLNDFLLDLTCCPPFPVGRPLGA